MPKIRIKKVPASVIRRINSLPEFLVDHVKAKYKKDAQAIVKTYTEGIQSDSLGLQSLKDETIMQKIRKGYPNPTAPLFGKGGDRSYSELLKVYEYKESIRIAPFRGNHHSGIPFKILFIVHEYGAIIRRKTETGTVIIKIDPRPALMISYLKVMRGIKKNGHPELKKEVNQYIRGAKAAHSQRVG